MNNTDNVEQVMTELSHSMTKFLKVASTSELFVFAIVMGALSGVVQASARVVVNGLAKMRA
jgi:hypothetical protein